MNSRQKGKRGELEAAKLLRDWGYEARRGQQYSGATGDADVIGIPGVHIEVKRTERLNIYDAMEQSARDAREGETPIVLHRRNNKPWLVIMLAEDYITERQGRLHCKDCRYWQDAEYGVVEMPFCRLHGLDSKIGEAEDYCSKGEACNDEL